MKGKQNSRAFCLAAKYLLVSLQNRHNPQVMPEPKDRGQGTFSFLAAAFLKRQKADGKPPAFLQHVTLLDFSDCASFYQLLQCSFGISFGNAFLYVLGPFA
jgi:hypothetical protein